MAAEWERTYLCIDLKSFYASVECADRGLDPFTTDLVVADPTRSANTICLAITPSMKAKGVRNRCRVREIPAGMDYMTAMPRMARYMEVSNEIYRIYLDFIGSQDAYPYSIDEAFFDATSYLRYYGVDARTLAKRMIAAVRERTGITATAGIGPNMFLCKLALDITAKHADDGIGVLDDESFRREVWFHHPLTDIWGIGPGISSRLAVRGIHDLAGICAEDPRVIRRMFGRNGDILLDHAWGAEPVTIAEVRAWEPRGHSMTNGQVLMRDYTFAEARTVLREMAYESCLELTAKGLACDGVGLYIGYSGAAARRAVSEEGDRAEVMRAMRAPGMHAGGQRKLGRVTSSEHCIAGALMALYDETVSPRARIRRVNLSLAGLVPERMATRTLFDDEAAEEQEGRLARAMVAVRGRFGKDALLRGVSLREESNAVERNHQIGGHHA